MSKRVVLLVSFGGPRSLADVPGFMRALLGRELPPAAEQDAVERYRLIGGRSPLPQMTEEHAKLLERELDGAVPVRPAFRYAHPSIEECINQCRGEGVEEIVLFIMTPYYTSRTAGNYIQAVERHCETVAYHPTLRFIHSWCAEPGFVDCWTAKIRERALPAEAFYLFSAHSLPVACAEEPYRGQIERTVDRIAAELHMEHYKLAWQSIPVRSSEQWFGPTVESVMDEIADRNYRTVVQIPIGFVTDHMETLYDIDILHKKYASAKGLEHTRVPCLNTDPSFIALLKQILSRRLQEET